MKLLLATDFDGTVAPIELDPSSVVLDPRMRMLFQQHHHRTDVALAFISGRDLSDLRERTAGVFAYRSGSHGLEIETPEGNVVSTTTVPVAVLEAGLEDELTACGVRVERKRFGVAAHWRGSLDVDRSHAAITKFENWALTNGLVLQEGRSVLEARVPGPAKLDVLTSLAARTEATLLCFAGDDLTDLPALAFAGQHGHAYFVRSDERSELLPDGVEEVDGVETLLQRFRSLLT